ncbi:MAG: glycerophosphodiester phosphodiesterase family protein [Caldilineaceae bacterium]
MFNRWNVARVSFTSFLLVIAVKVAVFYAPVSAPTLSPVEIASPTTAESSGEMVVYPLANFDVQGHRGARGLKPENTLPAFETALDLGVDTLELDLHLTADDVVVIWHDDTVSADKCRLDPAWVNPNAPDPALAPESERMIRRLTFAQLQEYRCDLNPDEDTFPEQNSDPTALAGDDFRIVSLDQLFAFVEAYTAAAEKDASLRQNAGVVRFNLETKRNPRKPDAIGDDFDGQAPGIFEQAVVEQIQAHRVGQRVTIQSFDHRSLWATRRIAPQLRLSALVTDAPDVASLACQGCTVLSPAGSGDAVALVQAHAHGVKVIPWTVNDPNDMQRLISMGVDGLITDRPDLLVALEQKQE